MPIYEYRCGECRRKFEKIVLSREIPEAVACPKCGARRTERLVSRFATASKGGEGDLGSDMGGDFGDDFGEEGGDLGSGGDHDMGGEIGDEGFGGGSDEELDGDGLGDGDIGEDDD